MAKSSKIANLTDDIGILEKKSIQDRFIDAIYEHEDLVPYQTPARGNFKDTYLGFPIKKNYKKPEDRENFIFLEKQKDVKPSIRKQFERYPGNWLAKSATLEEAIQLYDQQNPIGKMKYIKQQIPEINFDMSIIEFFNEDQ